MLAGAKDRVQAVRSEVGDKGIVVESIERSSPTSYAVKGVEPARVKDVRDILRDYARSSSEPGGWDMREAGEGAWEDLKSGVQGAWDSMEEALKSARSKFK